MIELDPILHPAGKSFFKEYGRNQAVGRER